MELHEQMSAAVAHRRAVTEQGKKKFALDSKRRLAENLHKKFQTAFVCPLAQIEEKFGVLWRHKKDPEKMTLDERHWWEKYQAIRNVILNNGNNQIRAMEAELQTYTVRWDRHQANLSVQPQTEKK